MISFNAQGVQHNKAFISKISQECDILLLQEHWLPSFDKEDLNTLLPGWRSHCICNDEDLTDFDMSKRATPGGGVATLWREDLAPFINPKDSEGCNRILVTTLDLPGNPICIANCYLPSGNSKDALGKFEEDADRIHDIVSRFSQTHEVVIMGDLNEDHFNRNLKKERAIKQIILEMELMDLGTSCNRESTYVNIFLNQRSHIDHALVKRKFEEIKWRNISIIHQDDEISPANTSYHLPIMTVIKAPCPSKKSMKKGRSSKRVVFQRNETDVQLFQEAVNKELEGIKPELLDTESMILALQSIIDTAMCESTPFKICSNRPPATKGPTWTPELEQAIASSKRIHHNWKEAGRPRGDNDLWKEKKEATKAVRSVQRRQAAADRRQLYDEIENATENDSQLWHKLIQKRKSQSQVSSALEVEGKLVTDEDTIRDAWADYFQQLATPTHSQENFEKIRNLVSQGASLDKNKKVINDAVLDTAIKQLANGKAKDSRGHYAEQLKWLTNSSRGLLLSIVNNIFDTRRVPTCLKNSYKLPIGKKGKDPKQRDNYRGITVASIILKTIESICLNEELRHLADNNTSNMQFGFTQNRSPSMASLIITESIAMANHEKRDLFAASLDAKKAFDVVNQPLLLKKLYDIGATGTSWEIINSIYTDSSESIRWKGSDSRRFLVKQGVKQGSILSPTLYKIYINDLLTSLEQTNLGNQMGPVFTGTPTCADDVLLLAPDKYQLQGMLDVAFSYSTDHSYQIHPQKSIITQLAGKPSNRDKEVSWKIGDNTLGESRGFTHLGLDWKQRKNAPDLSGHIQSARRAAYSLMRIGLHGPEGLGPKSSVKIIQSYITPRLLYGVEATIIENKDLNKLEIFYRKLLRQVQGLPESSANEAVYLLSGHAPIKYQYHLKVMSMIGGISRLPTNHHLLELGKRQLALNDIKGSWFKFAADIAELYDINIYQQMLYPWPKEKWKKWIKDRVFTQWHEDLREAVSKKSSLRWLIPPDRLDTGTHPIWHLTGRNKVEAASIRARMLIGRYQTEELRTKFNPKNDPTCRLCKIEKEDTCHMISRCDGTSDLRNELIAALNVLFVEEHLPPPEDPAEICFAILNAGMYKLQGEITSLTFNAAKAAGLCNQFCRKLDSRRARAAD